MISYDVFVIAAVVMACGSLWTYFCIWVGYRMGRKSEGHEEPIFTPKGINPGTTLDFDPYHEPMFGKQQTRIPTIEGGR